MRRLLVPAAALSLTLTGCGSDAADPTTPTSSADPDASPSWFGHRQDLPSCGIDEPGSDDYPNLAARTCFREAFEANRPAELTALRYGDEGESIRAHFRVLGDGRYEIVGEHFPSPVAEYAAGQGWVRFDCDRFVFIDDPGAELLGAPWVNAEGECTVVDEVSG